MNKNLANYHTHSHYCDGSGEIVDYINFAITNGFKYLGFSGHAPLPFENSWTMTESNFVHYKEDVLRLKEEYSDKVEIFLGLEADYIPGVISPICEKIKLRGLDYTIGAVHFLGKLSDGAYFTIDGSLVEMQQGVNEVFAGDAQKAVKEYYRLFREMILITPPDIAAHLDLLKKNNVADWLFSETDNWYQDTVEETLEAIAKTNVILEINTGGITRDLINDLYPSTWIIKRIKEKNIKIMVNSDAHKPNQLTGYFKESYQLLQELGFKTVMQLTKTGWEERAIS